MIEPLTAATIYRLQQHAMNPAGVVYPAWRDDEAPRSQQTRRSRLREEPAVTILNREYAE